MSIPEIVLGVLIIVGLIALRQLIAHNEKEVQRLKRRLEKAGVIDIDVED